MCKYMRFQSLPSCTILALRNVCSAAALQSGTGALGRTLEFSAKVPDTGPTLEAWLVS